MIDIEERYKRLYTIDGTDYWVVLDEFDQKLLLRKETVIYDIEACTYIKDHNNPHLARVVDFYESHGRLIMFEELIQGRTLGNALDGAELPFDEARRIFLEICDGIRFLHKAKEPIAHGCINENNIMLTNNGTVKIVDYDDTRIVGNANILIQKDLHALGSIAKMLFHGKYKTVVNKALSDNPERQYNTIDDLIRDVDKLIVKSKSLFPPPGFRTGNVLKAIIAIAFYVLMVLNIIRDFGKDTFFHFSCFNIMSWCLVYFFIIDIWTDWTGMTARLPGASHKNVAVKVTSKIAYSIIVIYGSDYFLKIFDSLAWLILNY